MAVISNIGKNEGGSSLQVCFLPNTLQACAPSTKKGVTIFRPIPEIDEEGNILPMVTSDALEELDFSNTLLETVARYTGTTIKFTGLCRSSDRVGQRERDMVFPLLFIRLRGLQKEEDEKAGVIPKHLKDEVYRLLGSKNDRKAALQNCRAMCMMQGIVLRYDGQELPKPRPRQAIMMTKTATKSLAKLMSQAYKRKDQEGNPAPIDIFSPDNGRAIILTPEEQQIDDQFFFTATLGEKIPLSEEQCRKLWVPWEKALNLMPHDEHVRMACRCFPRAIVELAIGEEAVAEVLGVQQNSAPVTKPAAKPAAKPTAEPAAKPVTTLEIDLDEPLGEPLGEDDGEESTSRAASAAPDEMPKIAALSSEELAAQYESVLGGLEDDLE